MRKGFTLIELLTVTAVMALLAAVLLPVLVTARAAAQGASCAARERQIGLALSCYTQDWEGYLPLYCHFPLHNGWWWDTLGVQTVAACPIEVTRPYAANYLNVVRYGPGWGWNLPGTVGPVMVDQFPRPAATLILSDGLGTVLFDPFYRLGPEPGLDGRHRGGVNALYLDGHVHWIRTVADEDWGRF